MKHLLLLLFSLSLCFHGKSQLKTYDMVSDSRNAEGKPKVVYFTGLWCKPCMVKLKPVMDSFSRRSDIDFIVLFDRYGLTENSIQKLSENYDTSFFRVLPAKYYPVSKSNRLLSIKVNPSNKAIDAFIADYNMANNTKFTTDTIWVGNAFVQKGNTQYFTKESETGKLIKEIDAFLNTSN